MWKWRDGGDGSDQAGRHRSQARLVRLVKSEGGDPAQRLNHHPARARSTSGLL